MKPIKTIGVSLMVAAAAMLVAGAAMASAAQFRSEHYPGPVSGSQGTVQKFSFGSSGANLKCTTVKGTATATAGSPELSVTPEFSGCTLGGLTASVTTNGCRYIYGSSNEAAPFTGTFEVNCPERAMEIKQGSCLISIPAQKVPSGMTYTNAGTASARTITATFGLSGLTYLGSSSCAPSLIGSHGDASLSGTSLLSSSNGLYLSGHAEPGPQFTSAKYPVRAAGIAASSFRWGFASNEYARCTSATFQAENSEASSDLHQSTTFSGCQSGLAFTVSMNGCTLDDYLLKAEGSGFGGGLEIVCPEPSKKITLTEGVCVLTYPAQDLPGSVTYQVTESGGLRDTLVNLAATGVKYNVGSGCPENQGPSGAHEDGSLSGSWILHGFKGETGGAEDGLWIQ